jgi:hypothetical protein
MKSMQQNQNGSHDPNFNPFAVWCVNFYDINFSFSVIQENSC